MKTVISAAGNLKRENPDMNEVWKKIKKISDLARIRTWNLLIRSQTRYPLRHKASHVLQMKIIRYYCHM